MTDDSVSKHGASADLTAVSEPHGESPPQARGEPLGRRPMSILSKSAHNEQLSRPVDRAHEAGGHP